MPRLPHITRLGLHVPLVAALLAVAGCATTPKPAARELPLAEQQALLRASPGFILEGRVAVRAGEEGWQASLRWRQRGEISEVRISGPFGAGALQLRLEGETLTVTDARGQRLQGEPAREAIERQLGFSPPLAALRHWLLALPAPAGEAQTIAGPQGMTEELRQQDWTLRFEDYRVQGTPDGGVMLPRRLTATRDAIRLRLVVDRWSLGKAG